MRAALLGLCFILLLAPVARAQQTETEGQPRIISPAVGAVLWSVAQLIPSAVLVTGSEGFRGGMRWQLTALVFAFGLQEHRFRSLWVPPVARASGAIELYVSPGWLCCAPNDRTGWMLHAGSRVYFPLDRRGENLSASLGASYYRASPRHGVAFELTIYTLSSIVGLSITVAPWLSAREVSTALTIRFY